MRYVEWVDSTSECDSAWADRRTTVEALTLMTDEDMICKTAGFVLFENSRILCITQSYHDTEVGACLTIPVDCIRLSVRLEKQ